MIIRFTLPTGTDGRATGEEAFLVAMLEFDAALPS